MEANPSAEVRSWSFGGESGWRPASSLLRIAGGALDAAFRHIALIPATVPATDWAFRTMSVLPAALFVLAYFGLLALFLRYRGLTPGGFVLGYRVANMRGGRLEWGAVCLRLSPYIAGHMLWLWLLSQVFRGMEAAGSEYTIEAVPQLVSMHGGVLLWMCKAAQLFLIVDLAFVTRTVHRRSLTDLMAGSVVLVRTT